MVVATAVKCSPTTLQVAPVESPLGENNFLWQKVITGFVLLWFCTHSISSRTLFIFLDSLPETLQEADIAILLQRCSATFQLRIGRNDLEYELHTLLGGCLKGTIKKSQNCKKLRNGGTLKKNHVFGVQNWGNVNKKNRSRLKIEKTDRHAIATGFPYVKCSCSCKLDV